MPANPIAVLHEVHTLLLSYEEPADIRRAAALDTAAEKVVACSVELVDVTEPDFLQQRLASAVKSMAAATKAARAHRRNPLTRPLSHARFSLHTGRALGAVHGVLQALDPENTPPVDFKDRRAGS